MGKNVFEVWLEKAIEKSLKMKAAVAAIVVEKICEKKIG